MNSKAIGMSLIGTAAVLIATTSAAFSGELVTGGALAPPPQLLPSAASPPEPPLSPHQISPNVVDYTGHAYTGHNLFGTFEGIVQLDRALGVMTVAEHDQVRWMQQHGDLLGSQKLFLHAMEGHLMPLDAPAPLGALATLAGYYIAIASDCELPTAPIEAALDKMLLGGGVAPSEADRYKFLMIQSRGAFAGAGTVRGCFEAKSQIDGALH
jgi:hypothetical protein